MIVFSRGKKPKVPHSLGGGWGGMEKCQRKQI